MEKINKRKMKTDYRKNDYYFRSHHQRFAKFVQQKGLSCQECRGEGGWKEIIDPEIGGPWFDCGWCEGTGFMTPFNRGYWLRYKKQEKDKRRDIWKKEKR